MRKQELLKYLDKELLDRLFGFCYTRTKDSNEAGELCSDIVLELVKTAQKDGQVDNPYPFIWRVARHVYATFSEKKKQRGEFFYEGDAEEILSSVADEEPEEQENEVEAIRLVYRQIAFLTKAYRDVMILFYLDGLSTAEIAKRLNINEGTVRQRLFSARQKIRSEVENMVETAKKPVSLEKMSFDIIGNGSPGWGDPRDVLRGTFSTHVIWLCRKKPMSAKEIAEELNVPTLYVEEELDILTKGANGKYGLLRRLDNGKYVINFILFDNKTMREAQAIYEEQMPKIAESIEKFVSDSKEEYMAFPYLNRKVDWNLILWQQIMPLCARLSQCVKDLLSQKFFADVPNDDLPFHVFGYVSTERKYYGYSWNGVGALNVCGFSEVHLENISCSRVQLHFGCGMNVANNTPIQLALRAIDGLAVSELTENVKEAAAKAVKDGYLYREGDTLYTKILVCDKKNEDRLFAISDRLFSGSYGDVIESMAEKLAALIRRVVPDYLMSQWGFANELAYTPIHNLLIETLIEKGVLVPPEDGVGAEGCWMAVKK